MLTLTRKQREIQQRENRILEVSLELLLKSSYHGLSMDRIAEVLEYSKGTIYQHFSCKEEILVALANKAIQVRLDLFRRAASFRGRSRERLQGVGVASQIFLRLYPHYFTVEQIIRLSSVWEKTSPERRAFLHRCEEQCAGIVAGIVRDAVASGDLELPPDVTVEDVIFGVWALNFGACTIMTTSTMLTDFGIPDAAASLRWNHVMMLDGYGWKPLSRDFDHHEVDRRLSTEVFAPEFAQLAAYK